MQTRNTKKKLNEIKKGIAIGLLLTSFYASLCGVKEYIYNLKTKFEEINGYKYKWSENKKSTFVKRNLGYEKRFSKTTSPEELENGLRKEYCNAVKEIKKVDRKIVPGTNIPFKKATYRQVDDAYKEYLQKIAQIRDIFIYRTLYDVELVDRAPEEADQIFENNIKCKYNDTKWNIENSNYMVSDFYNSEIGNYYSE